MEGEKNMAGAVAGGGVPNFLGTLPRVAWAYHRNGWPRLGVLVAAKACRGPPSSAVRLRYSMAPDHHAHWDF